MLKYMKILKDVIRVWGTIKYFKDGSIQYGSRCKNVNIKTLIIVIFMNKNYFMVILKLYLNKMIKTPF